MIKIKELLKIYKLKNTEIVASNKISLEFENNGMYFILGKSGCGKTTLLNILSGLDKYDGGEVCVNGKDIGKCNDDDMDEYRNLDIGVIFQEYNLIPELTVYDNLSLVLKIQEIKGFKNKKIEIEKEIMAVLEYVDLKGYEKRKISELSGGERQRIAVARAIIKKPKIILADEPTGNLDSKTSKKLFELLGEIAKKHIVIIVSHDKESASKYADYIIEVSDGKIINYEDNSIYKKKVNYSFDFCKDNNIYNYENVNKEQLLSIILKAFSDNENKDLQISNIKKIDVEEKNIDEEKLDSMIEERKIQKSLGLKDKVKLSLIFLKKKVLRLVLTILILSISIMMMYSASYITFYNDKEVLINYMDQYKPDILPIYKEAEYEDAFFNVNKVNYSSGEAINNILNKMEGLNISKYIEDQIVFLDNSVEENDGRYQSNVTVYILDKNIIDSKKLIGNWAIEKNQIVISDYIASELGLEIDDQLEYEGSLFTVSGIVETDYIKYDLKNKMRLGEDSKYLYHYYKYYYNVAYINEEFMNTTKLSDETFLRLKASNFTISNYENHYLQSEVIFNSHKNVSETFKLIEGRLPDENEVIVSKGFYEEFIDNDNYKIDKFEEQNYKFRNIHDELYNDYYSQNINLYSYFKGGIKIVGIFEDERYYDTSVLVNDDAWSNIKKEYYQTYLMKKVIYAKNQDYSYIIDKIYHENIYIDEPAANEIKGFYYTVKDIKKILYLLLVLVILLNVFMIVTFINISINENNKNIGIIRSLGIASKDCSSLFKIEFKIIYVFSTLISLLLVNLLMFFSNDNYNNKTIEMPYEIVCWNIPLLLVVLTTVLLLNTLASNYPIHKLNKLKPVEIINKK